MLGWLARLPLPLALMTLSALLMQLPAIHALVSGDMPVARVFFWSGLLFGALALFVVLALAGRPLSENPRRHLLALLLSFAALPLMLAFPLHQALGNTSYLNAWVEMVSSLTTTGASLFDPARLPASVHLWRGLIGWLGGLIMWVAAIAILSPMAIGGFEVRADPAGLEAGGRSRAQGGQMTDTPARIRRHAATLAPIYAGLTLLLWVGLIIAGDSPFVAFMHALSTMATSGISPVGGPAGAASGVAGELLIAIFLVFAISRTAFLPQGRGGDRRALVRDPEVRLGLALFGLVSAFLFLRHWLGAYEVDDEFNLMAALRALWGTAFTVLGFLTTTGFASGEWASGQAWSGLATPGLILMGLALVGGGVATTAGGAKLLRVYALYRHSVRELERLVLPHSVAGRGAQARHLRTTGAFRAWIFFMLLVASVTAVVFALAAVGQDFAPALVLSIAAITTTGPLTQMALAQPIELATLAPAAKVILGLAMILGRLEMLAIVALFSRDLWRR